jgi:hypothetical protein
MAGDNVPIKTLQLRDVVLLSGICCIAAMLAFGWRGFAVLKRVWQTDYMVRNIVAGFLSIIAARMSVKKGDCYDKWTKNRSGSSCL